MTRNPAEEKQENRWKGEVRGDTLRSWDNLRQKIILDLEKCSEWMWWILTLYWLKFLILFHPPERLSGTSPIECDERLTLTLHYLATGESFQSLSFQYQILLNAVSYIVKPCCKAIVEWMASVFVNVPSAKAEWLYILRMFEERWNFLQTLGAIDGKHFRI